MNNVAIITARGGSKRIHRKNIKPFLGKPIIQYSIEAALSSNLFDEVMVSTDDNEIAEYALKSGAKVPFIRSAQNSDDHSTTADVLIEVLSKYRDMGMMFSQACCIYPTAPFVTGKKLASAYHLMTEREADSVIPVTRFSFPIWRSFKMDNNIISYNWPENAPKRSQDLPLAFHDCGQFYFFDVNAFLIHKSLVMPKTLGFEVPELEVQDIDNEEDWAMAEIKYSFIAKG